MGEENGFSLSKATIMINGEEVGSIDSGKIEIKVDVESEDKPKEFSGEFQIDEVAVKSLMRLFNKKNGKVYRDLENIYRYAKHLRRVAKRQKLYEKRKRQGKV